MKTNTSIVQYAEVTRFYTNLYNICIITKLHIQLLSHWLQSENKTFPSFPLINRFDYLHTPFSLKHDVTSEATERTVQLVAGISLLIHTSMRSMQLTCTRGWDPFYLYVLEKLFANFMRLHYILIATYRDRRREKVPHISSKQYFPTLLFYSSSPQPSIFLESLRLSPTTTWCGGKYLPPPQCSSRTTYHHRFAHLLLLRGFTDGILLSVW